METVKTLQARGGDINAHDGHLLLHVADMGRMDIARKLVAAGASIKIARAHASNIIHCDEGGHNAYNPYEKAAKRLGNLQRSLTRTVKKDAPAV